MKLYILLISVVLLFALALPGFNFQHETAQHDISQTTANVQTESVAEDTLQMAYSEAVGSDESAYHFQRSGAGYTATNAAHNLNIDISGERVEISVGDDVWQLSPDESVTDFTLEDNRLTLHRDRYDEWYVNGPVGLQQGFTLYEPSEVAFDVGGTLPTSASDHTLQIGDALTFSGLMAYDADGDAVQVAFEFEANRLVYAYDDTGADYPLTIDPWIKVQKLMADETPGGDRFGWAVALEGDTALIGSLEDDCPIVRNCGSAYVFTRVNGMWTQQAKLTAPDAGITSEFGSAVALDGDTALISAPKSDCTGGQNCGSAYIFTRTGSTWTQQAKLAPTDGANTDQFGQSLALDGDTILIVSRTGIYIYTGSGATWSLQTKLVPTPITLSFGVSVALEGDTALIGSGQPIEYGGAFVYTRSGSTWTLQAELEAYDPVIDDRGGEVALDGDTAFVGTFYSPCAAGNGCGRVYVFTRSGTTWSLQDILVPLDRSERQNFGISIALDGDTALIGASEEGGHGSMLGPGSAYVFTRSGGVWTQQQKLTPDDPAVDDAFGWSVALYGGTALIGDYGDDCFTSLYCGVAYVFVLDAVPLNATASCNGPELQVTISSGDGPFNITASAGINTPVTGVGIGTTTINGPEKWDNLTISETTGGLQSINLGQFKCRTDERPVPVSPLHRSRTTNPYPLFSWTTINYASNYRVFVFDNKVVADRTVDIRLNSGGSTSMTLSVALPDGRLFWRVRGRQNRVWSLWSVRFTLFKDPVSPLTVSTPMPTIELNPPSGDEPRPTAVPTIGPAPTFPPPPNSR